MFVYGCMDKLRMEPKVEKNHESEEVQAYDTQKQSITLETICEVPNIALPVVGANVSCCRGKCILLFDSPIFEKV